MLHRQVKRPVYQKKDRLLLVLLAKMVRTWKEALLTFPCVLEAHIQGACQEAEALARDSDVDQGNGNKQPSSSERSAFGVSLLSWIFV